MTSEEFERFKWLSIVSLVVSAIATIIPIFEN